MTEEEMAEEYIDTLLNKDDTELDKFLDENLVGLKLNEKQAGTILGAIKGVGICSFLAGLKAGKPKWYKLSEKYPEADKLVRVRLMSGMEHICETCYYEPTEDEIGYGKLVITFYELNGEWVDDNDIIAWCEIPQYKDKE